MVLNASGGPKVDNLYADAPIIISNDHKEFFKQPYYYVFGHFSKFFQPDSIRVETAFENLPKDLRAIAFSRPDNLTAVMVFNK